MSAQPVDPTPESQTEPDPRLPSGPWVGFWLQSRMKGRQWMRDLHLRFQNGRVEGGGVDCVGRFTIRGEYSLPACTVKLFKQYLGAHIVEYSGQNDDDGRWVWGVWTLREATGVDRGGFHIWPKGERDPTQRRLAVAREIEVETEELVPAS